MRFGKYTQDEVEALVDGWLELRESSKPFVRVRLMDLERSVPRLTLPLRQAVVLHGQLGHSTRQVAKWVGVDHTTVVRRYANGLEQLVILMNGG